VEWVGVVHSSTDSNFLQEVEELEKQKNEAKDDGQKKDIELQVSLKTLERDLAKAKFVRDIPGLVLNIMSTNI
jgi:hypothetical protein